MLKLTRATAVALATMLLSFTLQAVSFGQFPGAGELETWSDETLKHQIKAKFKGMEGDAVKLETADGTVRKIPYNKLSLSSQLKVKKITDPKLFDAPPLPSSFVAPPVPDSPFTPEDTIDKFMETLVKQLKDGHAEVLWHAIPPKPRADFEATIVKQAEILGPNIFKQMQAVLPDLHTIIRDKRSFIVNSQTMAAMPPIAKALNQVLPAMEPLVNVLTKKETWNGENFKEGKVGPWMMLFAKDAVSSIDAMINNLRPLAPNEPLPSLDDLSKYKVVEKTADTASVEFNMAKNKQIVKFKKTDGYWLPEGSEKVFEEWAKAKVELDGLDQAGRDKMRTDARTGLTALNGVLGPLAKAKSQQEFNQTFDTVVGPGIKFALDMARQGAPGSQPGMMQPGMMQSGMNSGGAMGPPRKSIASGLSGMGGGGGQSQSQSQ